MCNELVRLVQLRSSLLRVFKQKMGGTEAISDAVAVAYTKQGIRLDDLQLTLSNSVV